jgi:hypothetical protein
MERDIRRLDAGWHEIGTRRRSSTILSTICGAEVGAARMIGVRIAVTTTASIIGMQLKNN